MNQDYQRMTITLKINCTNTGPLSMKIFSYGDIDRYFTIDVPPTQMKQQHVVCIGDLQQKATLTKYLSNH
jgi:hypothetical protein